MRGKALSFLALGLLFSACGNRDSLQAGPPGPASAYARQILADGPLGYWRLGESSGTTSTDLSGHGLTLTFYLRYMLGIPGAISEDRDTAIGVDGEASFLALDTAPPIWPTGSWSYELWAKVKEATPGAIDDGAGSYLLDRVFPQANLISLKIVTPNAFGAQLRYDDGNPPFGPVGGVTSGAWQHVVMVRDYSAAKFLLYVDGKSVATVADVGTPLPPPVPKWGGHSTTNLGAKGALDEIAIYPVALSPQQIQAHYLLGAGSAAR